MALFRKNKQERRAELISATAKIMLKKGFKAVTTRDVTARIGVGSGLLNHYFSWSELRCLAFETIADYGTTETFAPSATSSRRNNADKVMHRFVRDAFARSSEPFLRVWMEAIEEAPTDANLANVVNRCANDFRKRLEELLDRGNTESAWSCNDPAGAAWRILAVHDGLAGFVLLGAPRLSRREAEKHLQIAIDQECPRAAGA